MLEAVLRAESKHQASLQLSTCFLGVVRFCTRISMPAQATQCVTTGRYGEDHDAGCHTTSPTRSSILELTHHVVQQERFKGIRFRPELGRYISEIRPAHPRKRKIWLGTFKTAEEAARAFDAGIFYTKKPIDYNFKESPLILEPLPENLSPEQEHIEIQKRAKAAAARIEPSHSKPHSPDKSCKFLQSNSTQRSSARRIGHEVEHLLDRKQRPREIQFLEVLNRS